MYVFQLAITIITVTIFISLGSQPTVTDHYQHYLELVLLIPVLLSLLIMCCQNQYIDDGKIKAAGILATES